MEEETQVNPINPALASAYKLAKDKGYKKSIEDFQVLISKNENALNDVYNSAKEKGYKNDVNSFKALLGLSEKKNPNQSATTPSQSADIPLVTLSDEEVGISESVTVPNQSEVKPQVNAPFTGERPIAPKQSLVPKKQERVVGDFAPTVENMERRKQANSNDHLPEFLQNITDIPDAFKNAPSDVVNTFNEFKSISLSDKENEEIDRKVKEQDKGWVSTVIDAVKSNPQISGIKNPFFAPQTIDPVTKEKLVDKKIEEKQSEFIKNLPEDKKDKVTELIKIQSFRSDRKLKESVSKIDSIDSELELADKEIKSIENQLSNLKTETESLVEQSKKQGFNPTQEQVNQYNQSIEKQNELINTLNAIVDKSDPLFEERVSIANQVENEIDNLGTIEQEISLFKKNYGVFDNIFSRVGMGFADLSVNLKFQKERLSIKKERLDLKRLLEAGLANDPKFANEIPPQYRVNGYEFNENEFDSETQKLEENVLKSTLTEKAMLDATRNKLRPNLKVEEINSFGDVVDFTVDGLSDNISILSQLAIPYVGQYIFLVSQQAGNEIELKAERLSGENSYSDLQILSASTGMAISELAFSKLFGEVKRINTAKRILKTAGEKELKREISRTTKELFFDKAKTVSKEGLAVVKDSAEEGFLDEYLTNFTQNGIKKFGLGDDSVNLNDNALDAIAGGMSVGGVMSVAPRIAGQFLSHVSDRGRRNEVYGNIKQITQFQKILNEQNLDDDTARFTQDAINKLSERNRVLVNSTITEFDELPKTEKESLLKLSDEAVSLEISIDKLNNKGENLSSAEKVLKTNIENRLIEVNNEKKNILDNSKPKTQPKGDFFDINNVRERDAERNAFNPLETEEEAITRLREGLEGLEGKERTDAIENIAEQHEKSYLDYVATQPNSEEILNSDFAKNFKQNAIDALSSNKEFKATEETDQDNGSRVDEEGNQIPEAEFLEEQGKIEPIEDEVSPTVEMNPINTENIYENFYDGLSDTEAREKYQKEVKRVSDNSEGTREERTRLLNEIKDEVGDNDAFRVFNERLNEKVKNETNKIPKPPKKQTDLLTEKTSKELSKAKKDLGLKKNDATWGNTPLGDEIGLSATSKDGNSIIFIKEHETEVYDEVNDSYEEVSDGLEIELVLTKPEARGKGSARELISKVVNWADNNNVKLTLKVVPQDNSTTSEGLKKLYSEYDFIFTGIDGVRNPKTPTQLEEKPNQQPKTVSEPKRQTTEVAEAVKQPKTKRIRVPAVKNAEFDIEYDENGGVAKIKTISGREVPKFIERTLKDGRKKLVSNGNYNAIEAEATNTITENQSNKERKETFKTALDNFTPSTEYEYALEAIARGNKVSLKSATSETGLSPNEVKWATGFNKESSLKSIESLAEDIVANSEQELDYDKVRDALIDIISTKESIKNVEDDIIDGYNEESDRAKQQELEAYLNSLTSEEINQYEEMVAESDYLSELSNNEKLQYYEQQYGSQQERLQAEGLQETNNQPENSPPSVQERERKTKSERIKASNAKIDDIADAIKGFDSIFGIKLKIDDINGVKKNGVDMVDVIASVVKKAVEAGIEIDVAIQKAIEHFKKTLDFDVDINDIKDKVNPPRNAPNEFQKKQGKKSVFNRIYEGETEQNLKDAVQSNGLDYKVESEKKAQIQAKKFVDQVGVTKALQAAQDNIIKGAEKAFVYAEILDRLTQASENASIEELNQIQNDYNSVLDKALVAFDEEARNSGRFISALNKIYQTSRIKYSLAKQVADYKAKNNGEISEEVLTKFKEADKKIKELEAKIKTLEEERAKKAGNQAIQNIKNANERTKNTKKTPPPTIKAQAKKIANNIRQAKIHKPNIFSSATPATLVWDGAVEITAKAIEAGGTIADAIKKGSEYIKSTDWFKSLSKTDQKEALNAFNNSMVDSSKGKEITLSYDGEIKIPESLITQLVADGIEDINELSEAILEIIKQDDPNTRLTIREIRDAITKYGKTANPSQDAIKQKIAEMKRIGRLLSALEDVIGGNRPKKSGFQRPKPVQTERELTALINDKMKDLPVDEADLESAWRNALDKLKSRYRNRIEDLQKQIDKQERTKLERTPTKLDDKAVDLKSQIENLKTELDEIVGKETLTDEQKIKRTETALENSIKKLEEQIADGNIEFKEKPESVTSQKIEQLREARQALKEELNDLRKDAGIIEKRRIEAKKKSVRNAIEEYKRKLREKDFSKEKREPVKEDSELKDLLAEKIRWQEVYDREAYILELKNRSDAMKVKDFIVGALNIPRILMAGGEMSMVLIQGGIQTVSLATRNPKGLIRTFARAFMAVGSNRKSEEYSALIKADPHYDAMKKFKLGLTEADYKMEMREEEFIGNNLVYGLWNMIGEGLEYGSVKVFGIKDVASISSTLISTIKKDIKKEKVPISERFKNMNPLLALERGNTTYMNEVRRLRFLDGMKMLEMEGKNEDEHPQDYRKLARTINSLTGRAELTWKVGDRAVSLEGINDVLNTIFFSFKNTIAVFNQLNPIWYMMQHSPNDPIYKPSVAQKIAVRDMLTFVSVTTAFMYLLQAAAGWDDEEDEPVIGIDTDPRSTSFMQMKIKGKDKDIYFDPWHGMKPQVVFLARSFDGHSKNSKGEIVRIGKGYKAETHWDNFTTTYMENKFSPSMGMVFRLADSTVEDDIFGEEVKTRFGQPISETFNENFYPMFLNSIIEIEQEDPELIVRFLGAMGAFGLNSQTYGGEGVTPQEKADAKAKEMAEIMSDPEKLKKYNEAQLKKQREKQEKADKKAEENRKAMEKVKNKSK